MACAVRRLHLRGALPLGCVFAALWTGSAQASDLRLFGPGTLEFNGDVRFVAVDGEKSWLDGGLGKFRSGSDGNWKVQPQVGNVDVVWKPQFTWTLSAVIVGSLQGGERTEEGLSQAYLIFRPMRSSNGVSVTARAGLMWPPVSLEHEGADWHVADSITPSAINSWIGEEVRPLAAEGTISANAGGNKLWATVALLAANDTAGTLLTFRGWALHDRTTLAFNRWPLPPLDEGYQAPYTHPLLDVGSGFGRRPGYYAKLSWRPAIPVRFELFRYDNRADPTTVNEDLEWGWHTQFNDLGVVADLGNGATLKGQAVEGTIHMGFPEDGRTWIDNRFRSAFVLVTQSFGWFGASARIEAFGTSNRGSDVGDEYDDSGWSAMIAGKHDWDHLTGLVELLHVSSRRQNREDLGLVPRQRQTQLQAELRMHW